MELLVKNIDIVTNCENDLIPTSVTISFGSREFKEQIPITVIIELGNKWLAVLLKGVKSVVQADLVTRAQFIHLKKKVRED